MTTPEEMDELTREERVRQIAHSLWEREGRPEGRAEEHWFAACRIVDAEVPEPDWLQRRAPESVEPGEPAARSAGRRRVA
jgi:hypothetical protein